MLTEDGLRNVSGLVLTRKIGEQVVIGHDIVVTVMEVRSGQVKLLFSSPQHVGISRAELGLASHYEFLRKREEKAGLAQVTLPLGLRDNMERWQAATDEVLNGRKP